MKKSRRKKALYCNICPACNGQKTAVSSESDNFGFVHVKYTCDICGHERLAGMLALMSPQEDFTPESPPQ